MNGNGSLEYLRNVKGLKGKLKKGIFLNKFIVFDSIVKMKRGIIYAISYELNLILILNLMSRKIIKQIQLQNIIEIRIINRRFSILTTHNQILFVQDIHLNYHLLQEIDIESPKYSIFPLLSNLFSIYFKNTRNIQIYHLSTLIASFNANHLQPISMIWPLQKHPELIALYDSQEICVINWKLNQTIFKINNLKLQNPKKSIMCSLDQGEYLISSQCGMDILNLMEYDGYPKMEYWPRQCLNAQFISIIQVDGSHLIGSFLNEYQDYFLYAIEKKSGEQYLKQVICDYQLTQINKKSFLITFSHYDSTKFLIWE